MSEEVIDRSTYDDLKDMVGEDFISELVETFFEEAPELIEAMRQASADGDADLFRRSGHSLKSNSATFGAARLAALSRELEYMGRDGQLEGAEAKLDGLETEYQRTVDALKALV